MFNRSQQSLATCVGIHHHHGLLCFSRSLGVGGAEVQLAAAAALPLARWRPVPCAGCVVLCCAGDQVGEWQRRRRGKADSAFFTSIMLSFFCRTPPALCFVRSATFVAVRSLSLLRSLASLLVVVAVDDGRVWHGFFFFWGFLGLKPFHRDFDHDTEQRTGEEL